MAELSTLSPSPPALGDPHSAPSISPSSSAVAAPSIPAPESNREIASPKSSLYNDKALTGYSPSTQSQGSALNPNSPSSPPKLTTETPLTSLVHEPAPQGEESVGKDAETGAHVLKQEATTSEPASAGLLNTESETPALSSELPASPSPELNPGPNLYPNVRVTHNPNPVMDDGQFTAVQPQPAAASNPTPALPASTNTEATAEEEKPQQQAQKPQSPPPPLSPKPDMPSEARKGELPSTPTRAEPPSPTVPLIHEPAPILPMPKRPAPDTLSYLESASLMSGTLESLSGLGEDGSSVGSDSEINGLAVRRTDKYGFLGGNQYSDSGEKDLRVEVARQREVKWLDMFHNWDKWVKHRFQKVKLRCRKGIPSSLRAKAWQMLSNSQELLEANPGKFEELEREPGEAKWLDIIEKDLHRQFPFHEMFAARGGHGQQDLYRILKAYTIYRPDEGYCQAQAPVAAVLLMHMPAEQAFWCLVQICEKFLPGYYSAGLEAIQLDGEIFFSLLRRTCPMAYRHLKKFKIDPILYMTEWFMCIFSRTLPWACVLRVWDMFFCEGVKIVFRVGLVLLKQMLGSVDKLRELQGMYETMERLRNISPDMIREDTLVQEIIMLPVTESLIERECSVQVRKWRESRGELTHQPARRLHGTRAIFEYKRRAASISSGGSFSFLGSPIPPPGPLRASSSLLSLPGFRKSKAPFHSHKKGSFSGPSGMEGLPPQSPPAVTSSPGRGPSHKPPIPPGAGQRAPAPHIQSPLVGGSASSSRGPAPASEGTTAQGQTPASATAQSTASPATALAPSPKIVSEQITPTIPSPTANNAPLPPCPDSKKEAAPPADATTVEEDGGKKKKRSKEDKKKEKEDEKKKMKEKKEKEKAEKERLKKEKERLEKEKKKGGKKKDKGGGEAEDKNGATGARDSA
ncbi:TBC1 domain family member 10A-like [Acanthopagrus latus]|uniref:TBC1 domain family member 10A-like n=1 Tax=Acanthopagrus latus TaxID=8177 RepID=UPI00187CD9DC|nr:TBC1 domain family member 10A-like [Acanthopagrus latus]XP_036944743.1 TBC1 domain family member 10A-like [Acanthopagrus latus]XP_036944744.1 TBC1 domain family member 10A-like [Acanthopagrus latus]XP_036944745.1 TBC1 domain family member 10A-like [Acanthopagrus latus]